MLRLEDYEFSFDPEKDLLLRRMRNISFSQIIDLIKEGKTLDLIEHPRPKDFPNQRIFVLEINEYIHSVPAVFDGKSIFLKTAFANRKENKRYKSKNHDD